MSYDNYNNSQQASIDRSNAEEKLRQHEWREHNYRMQEIDQFKNNSNSQSSGSSGGVVLGVLLLIGYGVYYGLHEVWVYLANFWHNIF